MPIYTVRTLRYITEETVVDAPSASLARAMTAEAMNVDPSVFLGCVVAETPGAKSEVCRCTACTCVSFKAAWGAGWRTCPTCGQQDCREPVSA